MSGPFACQVCAKSLGQRRIRQGILVHPGCRRSLGHDPLDQALSKTQKALARMATRSQDHELAPLFAEATNQAAELLDNLRELKGLLSKPGESG